MTRRTLFRRAQDAPRGRKIAAGALMLALLTGLVSVIGVAQAGASAVTIFGSVTPAHANDTDTNPVELGTKFNVQKSGYITAIRFYKSRDNIGQHTGNLWSSSGKLLATVKFTNEKAYGWVTADLGNAVRVDPGSTYVVSYHTNVGHYAGDQYYFAGKGAGLWAVRALADGVSGGSGVYAYGANSAYPTSTYRATNYYVDVAFKSLTNAQLSGSTTTTAAPTTTKAPTSTTAAPTTTTTKAPTTTTTKAPVTPPPSGSVPCGLTISAKSCWASNTGVPGWTEADIVAGKSPLKHSVGNRTITQDNTVIDSEWIDGCVRNEAKNLTIKNSLIRTTNSCNGAAVSNGVGGQTSGAITMTMIDSEVDAGNVGPGPSYIGIGSTDFSLLRVNVHGGTMTLWTGLNVKVVDSFVHNPTNAADPNHTEAIDADSGWQVTISHNWISAATSPVTVYQTGGLSINNSWGPATYFTVTDNFIEGASGADVNFGCGDTCRPWGAANHTVFTGNRLSPNTGWGTQFFYGWNGSNAGNVWSDNRQSETLAVLNG
jgi:hypothetical protein